MALIPIQSYQIRNAVFEELVSVVVDSFALLCANQIWRYLLLYDGLSIRECLLIQQPDKPQERLCLAIVRRSRKQQQIGTRLRKQISQFITCHLAGGPGDTVSLINDDQVPAAVDDGINPLLVIFLDTFIRPAGMLFDWLDRVHRRYDLIVLPVNILAVCQASNGVEI